jgi:hypothetical protein
MNLLRIMTALGLVLVAAGGNEAANQNGTKKHHAIHGKVVAVHHGKVVAVHHGKDGKGSITVLVHHHKRRSSTGLVASGGVTTRKFHITELTEFARIKHEGKGRNQRQPASFGDVHKGEHVIVVPGGDKKHGARAVAIVARARG